MLRSASLLVSITRPAPNPFVPRGVAFGGNASVARWSVACLLRRSLHHPPNPQPLRPKGSGLRRKRFNSLLDRSPGGLAPRTPRNFGNKKQRPRRTQYGLCSPVLFTGAGGRGAGGRIRPLEKSLSPPCPPYAPAVRPQAPRACMPSARAPAGGPIPLLADRRILAPDGRDR